MEMVLSKTFYPLLEDKHRYLVLCGGRGSGKSEFAARKLVYRCLRDGNHRFLVLRKVRKTARESVIRVFEELLNSLRVPFNYAITERRMYLPGAYGRKNELLFDGLDDPEKIKSIKGITGIWMEEATEFTRDDFLTLDLCLREPTKTYHQIILTFNPMEYEAPWLKHMFFDRPHPDALVHTSTIDDNPIPEVRERYRPLLESLKEQDEALYKIARLGQWASRYGRIFNWPVAPLPADVSWDEIYFGVDFGYSVDPAAVIKVYRRADRYFVEEMLFETGLTNQDLAARLKSMGVGSFPVYCDAAEPKSIEELRRAGIKARESAKGADSVRASIDWLRGLNVTIVTGSVNLIREHNGYCWRKDVAGNLLPEPVKYDDHLIDAVRYAVYTHGRRPQISVWGV